MEVRRTNKGYALVDGSRIVSSGHSTSEDAWGARPKKVAPQVTSLDQRASVLKGRLSEVADAFAQRLVDVGATKMDALQGICECGIRGDLLTEALWHRVMCVLDK